MNGAEAECEKLNAVSHMTWICNGSHYSLYQLTPVVYGRVVMLTQSVYRPTDWHTAWLGTHSGVTYLANVYRATGQHSDW